MKILIASESYNKESLHFYYTELSFFKKVESSDIKYIAF